MKSLNLVLIIFGDEMSQSIVGSFVDLERRVSSLKKRVEELKSDLDLANAEIENAKCVKEITEQELRGCEVELKLSEASARSLENRISEYQGEISKVGSELEALKNEERVNRDDFIRQMIEFNQRIRNFQKTVAQTVGEEKYTKISTDDAGSKVVDKQAMPNMQASLTDLEDKLKHIVSQTHEAERDYQEEENIYNEVQQKLFDLEKRASLMDAIVKEMKELQELTRQTTELEETCTSLSEKLQKRCACPSCHLDNVGSLGAFLQENLGSGATAP